MNASHIPMVYAGGQEATLKVGLVGCGGRGTGAADNVLDSSENVQIGRILGGRIMFTTGYLWEYPRKEGMSDMEWQIRNWYYFDYLSGDHIVEQHVHQHDVTDWVMKSHPVQATALGGRQMRTEEL